MCDIPLLLQVGLVDTGKRSADDSAATQESRFERGVFTRRAFTVVFVTDNDPWDTGITVRGSDSGDGTKLASLLVENLVGFTVLGIDGANQAVLRNVFEVTTVLQPRSTGGNVVGGALALGLDQDGRVNNVLAVPCLERLEELKTVRRGRNGNADGRAVGRGRLESVFTGIVALGRELETLGLAELEVFAVGVLQSVGQGIESEVTGKDHGGDQVGRGDKGVGGGVGIVTSSKVTVVRGDDYLSATPYQDQMEMTY